MTASDSAMPRILVWDIENSPNLAHVWQLWNTNINPGGIQVPSEVMCFAAEWLDSDKTIFRSTFHHGKEAMLQTAHKLLSQADAVVSYNGKKHDTPVMNRDLLKAGFPPPAPYRHIDLDLTMKSEFRFPSHSLNYVSQELGIGEKVSHEGYALWKACVIDQDPKAWARMRRYNIGDVKLTKKLYWRVEPWIKNPLIFPDHSDEEVRCPNPRCRSANVNREGFAYTQLSKFQRYSCNECGRWFRSTTREKLEGFSAANISGG